MFVKHLNCIGMWKRPRLSYEVLHPKRLHVRGVFLALDRLVYAPMCLDFVTRVYYPLALRMW